MVQAATKARMTNAEYLTAEKVSHVRHEFLNGEAWAMAGGTPEHAALAMAVGGELRAALRGRPCRVYGSDARVRVEATGLSTYQDAVGEKEIPADAMLERLGRIIHDGYIDEFIFYEMGSRVDPHLTLRLGAESQERLAKYLRTYVVSKN